MQPTQEKATYDLHENNPLDPGYRRFLSRLSAPLLKRLTPGQQGLDFGCGPAPALALMLEEQGYAMERYDPWYADDPRLLQQEYDFICATEVVEHFHHPAREFTTLFRLLRPQGQLAIMTKLVIDRQAFSGWHYIRDLTHLCFYCRPTFHHIAQEYGAELSWSGPDVLFLQKH
nr:class I SAM-dependent methyltransferase [Desulfogranum mediterraneum]